MLHVTFSSIFLVIKKFDSDDEIYIFVKYVYLMNCKKK